MRFFLWIAPWIGVACASASGAEPAAGADAIATGRDCAPATTACEAGRCVATIDNGCDKPVTCQLAIESLCRGSGQGGPTEAESKRVTILSGTEQRIEAQLSCGRAEVVSTLVESVRCF